MFANKLVVRLVSIKSRDHPVCISPCFWQRMIAVFAGRSAYRTMSSQCWPHFSPYCGTQAIGRLVSRRRRMRYRRQRRRSPPALAAGRSGRKLPGGSASADPPWSPVDDARLPSDSTQSDRRRFEPRQNRPQPVAEDWKPAEMPNASTRELKRYFRRRYLARQIR